MTGQRGPSFSSKSSSASLVTYTDLPTRAVHPASTLNKILLQKCPQSRVAVTHDEDWALLSDEIFQLSGVDRIWNEVNDKFRVSVDPSGIVSLTAKHTKEVAEEVDAATAAQTEPFTSGSDVFPFPNGPVPVEIEESDYTVELLIEMLSSPTRPNLAHVRLLSKMLLTQTPPRFSSLQPVLTRLCSQWTTPGLHALGFEIMKSYWNNPKVQNASWPTTSDSLSCLTFFLDSPTPWTLDLWEVRFKALAAITKDGSDLRGIETVLIDVIKDCLANAFRLLTHQSKQIDGAAKRECERCIITVGNFLSDLLAHLANVSRIREELLMGLFAFYGNLIDDLIHLPSSTASQGIPSPKETPSPASTEKSGRRAHKRRAPSLSSLMFLTSPTNTEQPRPPPPPVKHPAELAIALFHTHSSPHLLHLTSEQLSHVLPILFRSLAFCASPLPRLTIQPQPLSPATLEDKLVDLLNRLVPSPSSAATMQTLKHFMFPHIPEVSSKEGHPGSSTPMKTDFDNLQLMIMTSLGAHRTLRNYARRALVARLEKVFHPQEAAVREGGPPRTGEVDLADLAWLRHDQHRHGMVSSESSEGEALSATIDAWVTWSPELQSTIESEAWDRILEGKDSIIEESAGILKDVYQELDSRVDGGLELDENELYPINAALRSLSKYILTLQSPDGSPFIINVFNPGDSPTPLLRSITTLLSRSFTPAQQPLLADILILGCDHVTDENSARIPALMMGDDALTPITESWLVHWRRLLDTRLASPARPQTRAAILETLSQVYTSIKESPTYRKALAQLVMETLNPLIASESSDSLFGILEEETIFTISESEDSYPVQLLIKLLFGHPNDSVSTSAARTLINIFSQVCFTDLALNDDNKRIAITIFNTFVRALSEVANPPPRLLILQFLMRLRADRDHRVYFALETYDTDECSAYLASLINRLPDSLMRAHKDEILEEHVARNRSVRPRTTPRSQANQKPVESTTQPSRGRSRTTMDISERATLWQLPEALSFKPVEPDAIKNGVRSFDSTGTQKEHVLPVSKYVAALADLIEKEPSWELVSYVLCHLPVQLGNKHLFCGPNSRTAITKLLYVLSTGIINGTLVSQTAEDCPEELKLRDLQGLAHHTLSTLISYKSYFDTQQRFLLVESFFSGLDGPFSTIKCCLHALSLSAFEISNSLSRSLPKILEKLAQIMSNPNMAVHILAFLGMVSSLPSLYASFTEEDFKMVFGVALQYLQHYNQLRESTTRSWTLSQHVRLQSYVTVYTWFSVLKLSDRQRHIPYITRQFHLANDGKEEVDGPTQVCFDWLARNTYGVANARKTLVHDIVLQPNIAKPTNSPGLKTWMIGNSFLSVKPLDRNGWIKLVSRRPSGSASLICRKDHFYKLSGDRGPPEFWVSFADWNHEIPIEASEAAAAHHAEQSEAEQNTDLEQLSLASHLFFHMSPVAETSQPFRDVTDISGLSKSIGILDHIPVIDTHKVGIMYVAPGQTKEIDILCNSHGSQAYTRFLDGIGNLVKISSEKDIYTGALDPSEDGEYAYAWWDDIRQILFHTATLMPSHPHDPMLNYKKRHIGNDFVRIIWNDSGLPYAFDTLKTAFQFVNIVIEPHSIGTISAFSNDAHENEYFRVTVQTAEGMTECTPVGQFKIVSAINLPHFVRHLSVLSDCFTTIFSSTNYDKHRVEVKSNWNSRLDAMQRFKKLIPNHDPNPPSSSQAEHNEYT
ncbi:tuberin [Coprinopsis marcescibilis]|uniref:Tuberin n=1 Tax=Coprinopsis marcescibilis TaxID=230819 RepID=A0A5C3KH35_COPMA|nr:tuberin [Coprinopsis marcescibilis]